MAASAPAPGEAAGKPLQSAMKLAKGALELDAGDRPWVRRGALLAWERGEALAGANANV